MQRGDLIKENGPIFVGQGQAMAKAADFLYIMDCASLNAF